MHEHKHYISGTVLKGRKLDDGEVVATGDMYPFTDGTWKPALMTGHPILKNGNDLVYMVRPQ